MDRCNITVAFRWLRNLLKDILNNVKGRRAFVIWYKLSNCLSIDFDNCHTLALLYSKAVDKIDSTTNNETLPGKISFRNIFHERFVLHGIKTKQEEGRYDIKRNSLRDQDYYYYKVNSAEWILDNVSLRTLSSTLSFPAVGYYFTYFFSLLACLY